MVPIYALLVSICAGGGGGGGEGGDLGKHCLGNVLLVAVDNVLYLGTQVGKAGPLADRIHVCP